MTARRVFLGAGLTALLPAAAWAKPAYAMPDAPMAESPLRVGVLADLTGPLAQHGRQMLLGAQQRARMLGPGVTLIERDAAGGPAAVRMALADLLDQGVHALIGTSAPWTATLAADAAQSSCTPLVIPAEGQVPSNDYTFQAAPDAKQVLGGMAQAAQDLGAKKVSLLGLDPLSTPDTTKLAAAEAANRGLQLLGLEKFAVEVTDLVKPLTALLAPKPDALQVLAPAPHDAIAVRDARSAGFTGPIICPPGTVDPAFLAAAGPAAEGVSAVAPWVGAPELIPEEDPAWGTLQHFTEAFNADNGPAGTQAGYGADAVGLLNLAFLGHRDRKMARQQLEGMCAIGVCGVYNMSPTDHSGLSPSSLTRLTSKGGKWTAA